MARAYREDLNAFILGLGLDPDNVATLEVERDCIVVHEYQRQPDGTLKLGPLGPLTAASYHHIYTRKAMT